MKNNRIRLTESQLHNIIRRCVNEAIEAERNDDINHVAWNHVLCVENNLGGDRYNAIIEMLAKKVRKGECDVEKLADSQFLHKLCMEPGVDTFGWYRMCNKNERSIVRHEVAEALVQHAEEMVEWQKKETE